ncbi:MAG: replicative DNA helicase [Arenimonas sp. SCN 70-307]|uniref:replicative DNA helicase n=1 Tax=Arenimonas sp. SCN 70-307 TaxID=1660089 RepID=UPI00086C8E8C|nr:replicative DNA helicase [Arenimonas sp. SCN 70-307]ODS62363.1 MAG: replicative DNA helicase [Arenimonas sp. SCN 70-307]
MSARPDSFRNEPRIDALRVPPQSVEAEQAVLGGLMLAPESLDRVGDFLTEHDFYRRDHRLIYRGIRELSEKNKPFDAVTLGEWFEANGLGEQIGGTGYLVELASTTPSAANIRAYAEIVREKSVLRQLIEAGTEIVNDGFQPEGRDSQEVLSAAEQRVFKIAEQGRRGRADFVTLRDAMKEAFQVLQERYENQGNVTGLPTGFNDLDELTAGLQPSDLIILAARPAMGKCLSADAEIVQEDGSIATIGEICARREARLATLGDDLRLAWTAPSDFVDDGHKPTFEVTTRLGRRVEATAPHPFLTLEGWKPLLELSQGDYVAVPRQLPVFGNQPLRECELTLLAYLVGDGGLTGSQPRFTNSNPQIVADFEAAVAAFGGVLATPIATGERTPGWGIRADAGAVAGGRRRFAAGIDQALSAHPAPARAVAAAIGASPASLTHWRQGQCVPDAATTARLCQVLAIEPGPSGLDAAAGRRNQPNAVTQWLRELGLMGQGAATKHLPAPVFTLPREQLAHFLNRLFATDGWATVLASGQAQVGYASTSGRLARQLQHLLLRFGIVAKLRQRWVKYRDARRPAWQLDITDADSLRTFCGEIGIHGKQPAVEAVQAALAGRKAHSNVDLVPAPVWKLVEQAKGSMSWAELARRCGFNASNLHVGKRGLSRPRLARIAMVLGDARLSRLASSDVVWDRIESIRCTGVQQVYDLTVPGTHNFIANDVCVHNTTLALNIAEYGAIKTKKAVAVYSMEMSSPQLAFRLISSIGRINATRLRTGQLEDEDWSRVNMAIKMLSDVKVFIDDTPALSPDVLRSKARRIKREHDLGLIVVDYLQLMQVPGTGENRTNEISEISRSLKALAKELNVPVIALSQLNRGLESRTDKRPVMADLRESGAIEQDADIIMFIYRDEYYHKDSADKGLAEVIIAKQRSGPTGMVKLKFFGEYTRFDNLARDSVGSFE